MTEIKICSPRHTLVAIDWQYRSGLLLKLLYTLLSLLGQTVVLHATTYYQVNLSQQEKKKHNFSWAVTRTAGSALGRVGRGEQGGARPGNSAPRGGPILELPPTGGQTRASRSLRRHGQHTHTYIYSNSSSNTAQLLCACKYNNSSGGSTSRTTSRNQHPV